MQRSDYLNPSDIRGQCMQAVRCMEENVQALETIGRSMDTFAGDSEIESESFDNLVKYPLSVQHLAAHTAAKAPVFPIDLI